SSAISAPATNARSPAPVTTVPRTSSSAVMRATASPNSRMASAFRALRFSGRWMVSSATGPSKSSLSVSKERSSRTAGGGAPEGGPALARGPAAGSLPADAERNRLATVLAVGRDGLGGNAADHAARVLGAQLEIRAQLLRHEPRAYARARFGLRLLGVAAER